MNPTIPNSLEVSLSVISELANYNTQLAPLTEEQCKSVVESLYEALNKRDVDEVHRLLAPDLDWWYHGPPNHMHLMHLLTGSSQPQPRPPPDDYTFVFTPLSIVAFGSTVLVEGYDMERSVSWVHAWSVNSGNNIITQVREYFNTSLTVTRIGSADMMSIRPFHCQDIWQSTVTERKSVPGLILAL